MSLACWRLQLLRFAVGSRSLGGSRGAHRHRADRGNQGGQGDVEDLETWDVRLWGRTALCRRIRQNLEPHCVEGQAWWVHLRAHGGVGQAHDVDGFHTKGRERLQGWGTQVLQAWHMYLTDGNTWYHTAQFSHSSGAISSARNFGDGSPRGTHGSVKNAHSRDGKLHWSGLNGYKSGVCEAGRHHMDTSNGNHVVWGP